MLVHQRVQCDHLIQRKGIGFGAFRGTFCFDPLVGRQNDTWKWQLTHPTYSCPSMPFLAHYTLLYDDVWWIFKPHDPSTTPQASCSQVEQKKTIFDWICLGRSYEIPNQTNMMIRTTRFGRIFSFYKFQIFQKNRFPNQKKDENI